MKMKINSHDAGHMTKMTVMPIYGINPLKGVFPFKTVYETVYERSSKNMVWSIKNSGEVLSKLKSRGFRATSLSTYDFFLLFIPLYPII